MAVLRIANPQGMRPGITPLSRPPNIAATARNCKMWKGDVRPFRNRAFVVTPAIAGVKRSIFRWGSNIWFHWLTDVNVAKGPVSGDDAERVYYTGDGPPKMTYSPIATTGGATGFPKSWRTLGVPAPSSAPTVALGAGGGCATSLQSSTSWVYTLVTNLNEESPPSPVSASLMLCPGQTVNFSGLAITPPGGGTYTIAKRNIYQSVTGSNGVVKYRLAHTINDGVSTTAAVTVTGALVTLLPSEGWDPPPADMHSIIAMPNGILAGLSKNDIYFSEPYLPHAWDGENALSMDFPGVGLGAFGSTLVVATQGHPYIVSGSTPASMTLEKVAINQACVSKRGIASMTDGVLYPSPDGLVFIGSSGFRIVTDSIMTRDDWQELVPSSITAVAHDGRYYGFYDTGSIQGGFVIDVGAETFSYLDTYATAVYSDLLTDGLFLQVGNNIEQWDAGAGNITWTWESTDSFIPRPLNFGFGRINGENCANITLEVYADDVLRATRTITDNKSFRLPSGFKARKWRVKMTGTGTWTDVVLSSTSQEIAST